MGVFFFFQAEDGIRDYKVTGVQTCALPISDRCRLSALLEEGTDPERLMAQLFAQPPRYDVSAVGEDRKSTRLNSSHLVISYAVFCLKKKKSEKQPELIGIHLKRTLNRLRLE